ncbi:DUF4469 domain-containing protein [Candidatus Electronema sp. PJ]|uniref:DUF4469 domain-containing protein n=1 Tax=Candidatus Electronema sp. PJ TaxID=3401572 RepID=UPI003AA7C702
MGTVQYRVELNPLTKPTSYRLRFLPKQTAGYDELAAAVAKDTGMSIEQAMASLQSTVKNIKEMLCNGMQVTLEEALTFAPSFHGKLNSPDDPLPPISELLRVSISATRPFIQYMQQNITLERVSTEEKAPSILSAADTTLELNNVLNPNGVLRLTGSNLAFDKSKPDCGCIIESTRSGSEKQSQFAQISDTEILLVPHIPVPEYPWNNEYTLSISTQYTEHGSVRTGTYGRKLRSPMTVDLSAMGEQGMGILTGSAAIPYVSVMDCILSANERLRIQVEYNAQDDLLAFRLIDMQDGGAKGNMVPVTENGGYTLPGFAGSAVSSLQIEVNDYAALKTMIRNNYDGRLVDILDLEV